MDSAPGRRLLSTITLLSTFAGKNERTRSIWKMLGSLRAAARRLFYIAIHQVSLLSHAACVSMSTTSTTTTTTRDRGDRYSPMEWAQLPRVRTLFQMQAVWLIGNLKKVKKRIAVCATSTAPLRELACHMGSHSVTCHPAELTFPPLPQPMKAGTRFSDPRGMQGWVDLVSQRHVVRLLCCCGSASVPVRRTEEGPCRANRANAVSSQ